MTLLFFIQYMNKDIFKHTHRFTPFSSQAHFFRQLGTPHGIPFRWFEMVPQAGFASCSFCLSGNIFISSSAHFCWVENCSLAVFTYWCFENVIHHFLASTKRSAWGGHCLKIIFSPLAAFTSKMPSVPGLLQFRCDRTKVDFSSLCLVFPPVCQVLSRSLFRHTLYIHSAVSHSAF